MSKIIENYILENILGTGQFGKVFKAKNTKDNIYYAIKSVKRQIFEENPKLKEFTVNEIHTLTKITNEHVVKFIEMIKTNNNFYFVYEFCNGGTLEDDLYSRGYFKEKDAIPIFQQIVKGLDSVTRLNIIHRDIKPQNILYHNGKIKIADFGFCKPLQSKNALTKTVLGSPIYMAPEILRGEDYTMKADIWSLGVLFYEMLYGKCPYEGRSIANLINLIDESELIFHESHPISEKMKNLLRGMLAKDPNRRIEWEKIYDIVMDAKDTLIDRKQFANLNVNIPSNSPRKFEHQCISLDNTPAIELNPLSFNQTIMNLTNDQGFSKPMNELSNKTTSYFSGEQGKSFPKEQNFINPSSNYNVYTSSKSFNPDFEPERTKNFRNEVGFGSGVKNRDSLHSSFHKHEKLEIIFSRVYKIEINHAILTTEALLSFLTWERNKILLISKVFYDLSIFKLMSMSATLEIYYHKYLYFHSKNFKEMLLDNVSLDVISVIANYNELCNSYDYRIVRDLFKAEMEKIITSFLAHKEKVLYNNQIKSIDKMEIESTNYLNLKNFYRNVLDYITAVKENCLFFKEEKYKSEDSTKYMIHAIEMIDSVLLNELFNNFIDKEVNFYNQRYFLNLKRIRFTGLLKILNQKIDYFKRKYLQE